MAGGKRELAEILVGALQLIDAALDLLFRLFPLRDISEYKNHAGYFSIGGPNRGCAVIDEHLAAVLRGQLRVIGESNNFPFAHSPSNGILHWRTGLFVADNKYFFERTA